MKKPRELTPKEKEFKIGSITLSLKEFMYGFQRLVRVAGDPHSPSEEVRFYQNAVIQYISIYFLLSANGVQGIIFKTLKEIGLENFGNPFRKIFSKKVGGVTFGYFIKRLRNKILTHGTYSSVDVPTLFIQSSFVDSAEQEKFAKYMRELYREIEKLHEKLMGFLPNDAGY